MTGDMRLTTELCQKLMLAHPEQMPLYFNCGVHAWQSNQDINTALKWMKKSVSMRFVSKNWIDRVFAVIRSLELKNKQVGWK
jgi:hypothetical protein